MAVPLYGNTAPASCRCTDQHQGKLPREDFIIGKSLTRLGMGRIAMDGMQRLPPRRPAFPRKNAGLDPFREFRRAFQGLSRELPQAVVGEALGQAVDRLPLGNVACLFGRQDIVRSEEHTSELQPLMPLSYAVFS